VLFPHIREAAENAIIVASGTSCRHQIKDGTQREAKHVVDVMLGALSSTSK
jgi:Fe-S oxidoreductase